MKIYHLYLKTHQITGMKYLGKTVRDPYSYKGSGKKWLGHLSKYGNFVTTELLLSTTDHTQIESYGLYYSDLWNLPLNEWFANLRPESGDGGDTSWSDAYKAYASTMSAAKSKCCWWNNGKISKHCEQSPGPDFVRGRGHYNNNGFKKGTETMRHKRWFNNGLIEMMIHIADKIPDGFKPGRIDNGKISRFRRATSAAGKSWWNNGQISKMAKERPGEDFIPGRLYSRK